MAYWLPVQSSLCFALQNGNLKHKVQGADTPLLSSQVLQLTPITADTDDLAVSAWSEVVEQRADTAY